MAKKKKEPRENKPSVKQRPSVVFEIEDDAEALFRAHLEAAFQPDKVQDAGKATPRAAPRSVKRPGAMTLDLHGKTLPEARAALDALVADLSKGEATILTIITGKGLHSAGHEAVLWREIPIYLRRKWAHAVTFLDEFPERQKLGDLPFKGHFRVKVGGSRGR